MCFTFNVRNPLELNLSIYLSHLDNLVTAGGGEAAIVSVEGADVPCPEEAGEREGGGASLTASTLDLSEVRQQHVQGRVPLLRHLI